MKDKLRKLRESRHLTQREFGIKIGVSDKVISKWERGASEPDIRMLKRVSDTFSVGIEELVGAPRLKDVAFPTRKAEKGPIYYTVCFAATLGFVAVTAAFCVLYFLALYGEYELARHVGDAATCFIPIAFGTITTCVFAAASQLKFKAYPILPDRDSKGKSLNEILYLPGSIRAVYSIYGKWFAFVYLFVQLWNMLNVAAYLFAFDSVIRYVLSGCVLFCIVPTSVVAGVLLKRVEAKDKEAYDLFY